MQVDGDNVLSFIVIKRFENMFEQWFCCVITFGLASGIVGSGLPGDRYCLVRQSLLLLPQCADLGYSQAAIIGQDSRRITESQESSYRGLPQFRPIVVQRYNPATATYSCAMFRAQHAKLLIRGNGHGSRNSVVQQGQHSDRWKTMSQVRSQFQAGPVRLRRKSVCRHRMKHERTWS